MFPQLHVQLFGDFCLFDGNQPVTSVDTPRLQALLAYLLLHRQTAQSRQHLAFLFWPDSSEAQARANLRQLLHYLRHALPAAEHFLQFEPKTIQWRPNAPWTLDVAEFERCLTQGNVDARNQDTAALRLALESAVNLYRGDLLPACYDEWVLAEREAWREYFIQALERLILLLEEARDYTAAITYAQRLLRHDPLHESTYRQLMRLYTRNDERASALHTYHTCVTVLQRELGVEPHPTTQEAYAHLLNMPAGLDTHTAPTPHPALETTLVGRQREWTILQRAWRRANHQGAHFVLVAGEAGIGKSRLVEELWHWVRQQGLTAARTRSYAAEGALAYAPVIEWLRSEAFRTALPQLNAVWLTEVARLLPELLIQQPQLPHPSPLNERWQRQRLFEALARAVLLVPQPLLLTIDDLQWCDQETLEWLHYLLRFDAKTHLLIVGTARVDEVDADHPLTALLTQLRREDQVTEIALGPLPAAETRILAAQTSGHALDDATLAKLVQFTEGNPLFIVETTRVQAEAWPAGAQETHVEAPSPDRPTLPPKILAVLQHRLRQLSPLAREVACLAAVSGRSFSLAVLVQATVLSEEQLAQALDELWQRCIIREQGVNTYDFSHDRLRDVAYVLFGPVRRRYFHNRIAVSLRKIHVNNLEEISATLAIHYEFAGLLAEAIDWRQQAASAARKLYALQSVIEHLQAAIKLLDTLVQTDLCKQKRFSLLTDLGYACVITKGWASTEVGEILMQSRQLSFYISDKSRVFQVLEGLRAFYLARGDMRKALEMADEAMSLAQQLCDVELSAKAHYGYGTVYSHMGEYVLARTHYAQAELLRTERIYTSASLGIVLWVLGYPKQALAAYQNDLIVAAQRSDFFRLTMLIFGLANVYYNCGELQSLLPEAERLIDLSTKYGVPLSLESGMVFRGWVLAQKGNLLEGIEVIQHALDNLRNMGHVMFQPYRLTMLIKLNLLAERFEEAHLVLHEATVMSHETGMHFWDAELYRLEGELFLAENVAENEAILSYLRAIEVARTQNAKSLELRATISLCRLWQRQGRCSEAYQRLAEIYGWFTEGFDTADLQAAKALLDELSS